MKRKFTKYPITASSDIPDSDYYHFTVYELDDDGDEVGSLDSFDTLDEAIPYAEDQDVPTHIVLMPEVDPDDDPEIEEWFEYNCDYEPYEVVWES